MVKISRGVYVDAYYYDEAVKRKLNISAICDAAIRKAVEEGHLSDAELRIYREHFGKEGCGLNLDHIVVFPAVTHFSVLDGQKMPISKLVRFISAWREQADQKIFASFLDDIKEALPTFDRFKGVKLWDSVHG